MQVSEISQQHSFSRCLKTMTLFSRKKQDKIVIKILQGSAVTQNVVCGLVVCDLFPNFLYRKSPEFMKISWHVSKL